MASYAGQTSRYDVRRTSIAESPIRPAGVNEVALIVHPVDGGWSVDCAALWPPLMFLSGSKAEQKAHELANSVRLTGCDVRVEVQDRAAQTAGVTWYWAS